MRRRNPGPKGRKASKGELPDEAWSAGPLRVARFGKDLIMQSHWDPDEFSRIAARMVAEYPNIVGKIDTLVEEVATLVTSLPAEELLQAGWWNMSKRRTQIVAESEISMEDGDALRMIDYVQSVIAARPPSASTTALTEEVFEELKGKISELFMLINVPYQNCATAKEQAENKDFNLDFEEFRFKAQVYWVNVRGDRYQVHEPTYLREMFVPHSEVLQELFGISGAEFAAELSRIGQHLATGLNDALGNMLEFRNDVLNAIAHKEASGGVPPNADFSSLMAMVVEENGWKKRGADAFGGLLGMDFFDVEKICRLPRGLLEELAWGAGEETEFFSAGAFCGWPLRVWPVFRRPFLRLNGRIYCFDHSSLFDNIYRVMQKLIERLKPAYKQSWNDIQKETSEALPFGYLERILPGAQVISPIYYPIEKPNGTKDWAEADGALSYDDHLFVIEVKAGGFSRTSPTSDFPVYLRSMQKLLLEPAQQGARFVKYLRSADTVAVFDKEHRQIGTLSHKSFRRITICPVTLDALTELAAQAQHLKNVGVDVGSDPVWAVSINDLRAYADIFSNPLTFLHFVEQRMAAFQSDVIRLEDELDHLGMYLQHNHYTTYAKEKRGDSNARMTFNGYRDPIDRFFHSRMLDPTSPCLLKQEDPPRFDELIEVLAASAKPNRSRVASALLDCDLEWRANIAKWIELELGRQHQTRRSQPLTVVSKKIGAQILFCCSPNAPRDSARNLDHARSVLLLQGDARGLLLEFTYGDDARLNDVSWTFLERAEISEAEANRLSVRVAELRRARFAKAAQAGLIGRNDPCPCGSTKKYKQCCLGR